MSDDYTHGDNMLDPDAVMADEIERLTAYNDECQSTCQLQEQHIAELETLEKSLRATLEDALEYTERQQDRITKLEIALECWKARVRGEI